MKYKVSVSVHSYMAGFSQSPKHSQLAQHNVSVHTKMPLEIWHSSKAMHVMNAHELWLLNYNNSEHLLHII